jgi:hypothetical protein
MVNIIPEKLEYELKVRHLSNGDVSDSLGHGRNYITDAYRRKRINAPSIKLLDMLYNIKPESYTVIEKAEEEDSEDIEPVRESTVIDYDRLEATIFHAVYAAVKKAWSE